MLWVSPHRDDGILSQGARIRTAVLRNDIAHIVNVFTEDRGVPELSPLACSAHEEWGLVDGMRGRQREEDAACRSLGVHTSNLGFTDALYRLRSSGAPRFESFALDLPTGMSDETDFALAQPVAAALYEWIVRNRPTQVRAPLGLGRHPDHVITRAAASSVMLQLINEGRAPDFAFYEDVPYVVTADITADVNALRMCAERRAVPVRIQAWLDKMAALEHYSSQHVGSFGQDWRHTFPTYAKGAGGDGFAEVEWTPKSVEVLYSWTRAPNLAESLNAIGGPERLGSGNEPTVLGDPPVTMG